MRSSLTHILDHFRRYGHPSKQALIEYIDRESNSRRSAKIKIHLDQCTLCRTHLEELRDGLDFFNRSSNSSSTEFSIDSGLQKLASAVQHFDQQSRTVTSPATYQHVLDELSIYLGRDAAMRVMDRVERSSLQRDRLRDAISPVVTAFLGPHTGSAVIANVLRIWDRSQESAA